MATKKQLGQFFTVNSDAVLANLGKYVKGKNIVDPFVGSGELLRWAKQKSAKSVQGFDIDQQWVKGKIIRQRDSINNPGTYNFVLTNPPYLNINKADSETKKKFFFDKRFEDLYHYSLNAILKSDEGIVIVPVNFLSAENSKKIRALFFAKFTIPEMNYFKYQVFPDTTYNVIAFYYRKKKNVWANECAVKTHIYPNNEIVDIKIEQAFDWSIGGADLHALEMQGNVLGVRRLMESDIRSGTRNIKAAFNHVKDKKDIAISEDLYQTIRSNILLLKAIDSGSEEGKLALDNIRNYGVECLVSKESSRHMIYLLFENQHVSIEEQEQIKDLFNKEIERLRKKHLSLFLTNYRDKDRKRISFDFAYKLINHIYFTKIHRLPVGTLFTSHAESVG